MDETRYMNSPYFVFLRDEDYTNIKPQFCFDINDEK